MISLAAGFKGLIVGTAKLSAGGKPVREWLSWEVMQ